MWIITKGGFVSLVQHNTDPTLIRARARRREHLIDTFNLTDGEVTDLGPDAPDYRFHADVTKWSAASAMRQAVLDIDYTSHVKEAVTDDGNDRVFYTAMLGCWRSLYRLQDPPRFAESQGRLLRDDYIHADFLNDALNDAGEPF